MAYKVDQNGRRILVADPNLPADLPQDQARLARARQAIASVPLGNSILSLFNKQIPDAEKSALREQVRQRSVDAPIQSVQNAMSAFGTATQGTLYDAAVAASGLQPNQVRVLPPQPVAPPITPTSLARAQPVAAPPASDIINIQGKPLAPIGAESGLSRIIKTRDANGNSVYTQAGTNDPTPVGGTSRIYDALGNRADVANPALGIDHKGQTIGDLYRGQDANADPNLATVARGQDAQVRLDALNAEGKATAEKNPIYRQLLAEGQGKPLDTKELMDLVLKGQDQKDKQTQTTVENARADKQLALNTASAVSASDERDASKALEVIKMATTPDKDGNQRGYDATTVRSLLSRANTDPAYLNTTATGGAAKAAADGLLQQTVAKLRPKAFAWLRNTINSDEAKQVSFANLKTTGKPGVYELAVGGAGKAREPLQLTAADVGLDERAILNLIKSSQQ